MILIFLDKNVSFNSLWKPERPFPVDMAAFAINLSLALDANAFFTYNVPRGYQVRLIMYVTLLVVYILSCTNEAMFSFLGVLFSYFFGLEKKRFGTEG